MSYREPCGAGARDRRVLIQQSTESIAPSGVPVESWTTLALVFARKDSIGGRERFVANQLSAPYDTRLEIPWRSDMDPDSIDVRKTRRLIYSGRVHDIVSAEEIGRRQGILLTTLAGGLVR